MAFVGDDSFQKQVVATARALPLLLLLVACLVGSFAFTTLEGTPMENLLDYRELSSRTLESATAVASNTTSHQATSRSETQSHYHHNTYDPFGAHSHQASTSPEIPWGSINIVVVTDVHSWISGHHRDDPRHWPYDGNRQPFQDADYGDVLGFYQNLERLVDEHNQNQNTDHQNDNANNKRDLFFVMNGDFVDGTGLSGYPPTVLAPLLHQMPWDATNVGNHELYHDETVRYLAEDQRRNQHQQPSSHRRWKAKHYLSSNTMLTNTGHGDEDQPLTGQRYAYLEGPNTQTTILTFGFLYDFQEGGSLSTTLPVEEVMRQEWFRSVLGDDPAARPFDAILVLAHMDCLHPLVTKLRSGIREALPPGKRDTIPIQFVTGHTHRRCHARLDANAESFEAGRFLDTIGFVSFDAAKNDARPNEAADTMATSHNHSHNFRHRFWDVDKSFLREVLVSSGGHPEDLATPEGRALSRAIQSTRTRLGLDEVLGCASETHGLFQQSAVAAAAETHSETESSLYDLYLQGILPDQLLKPAWEQNQQQKSQSQAHMDGVFGDGEPVFVAGTGTLRYSLFEGIVTVNDVIAIAPFDDLILEVVAKDENPGSSIGDSESSPPLPIYGWQLSALLEASNRIYKRAGEYGMPTFVLSTIDNHPLDPTKIYRLFSTDYDANRLITALSILKEQEQDEHHDDLSESSITRGRLYQSQPVCRRSNEDCYTLLELWKDYIRETMPCPPEFGTPTQSHYQPSLRWGAERHPEAASAQILQPPLSLSSTSAARIHPRQHSRMTPATGQNDDRVDAMAGDQLAAAFLVVVTIGMIAYLMVFPPRQHDSDHEDGTENRFGATQTGKVRQQPFQLRRNSNENAHQNENDDDDVDVQLIPLCRYTTGNLSEGSYGSI